jgi:ADP-ribose pyrophosphatase
MPTSANKKSHAKKAPAKKTAAKSAGKAVAKSAAQAAKPSNKPQILSSKVSFKGKVFSVTTEKVTEPGGVTSIRDTVRHNGSIVVLAVDSSQNPADPTILIERQYRHSAGQFLLELPAGRIEPGEAPLAAAKRELIEETGYRAKKWSKLTRYYASPGFLAETMQIFLAEDIRPGVAEPEEDEKIELLRLPLSELLHLIHNGKVLDGKTMIGILLYARGKFDSLK